MSLELRTKIAGVTFQNDDGTHRQELIEDLRDHSLAKASSPIELFLRRQPYNPFDNNAVGVFDPAGRQLGHISRTLAETVAPLLERGEKIRAELLNITGDGLLQNWGVNIRLSCDNTAT